MIRDPAVEWEYREIQCRLYKHPKPDGYRWAGYIKLGDEWLEAIDKEEIDKETAKDAVESFVSLALKRAKTDRTNTDRDQAKPEWPRPTSLPDPQLHPPNPDIPAPDPWKPMWIGDKDYWHQPVREDMMSEARDDEVMVSFGGSIDVETTNGNRMIVGAGGIDGEDIVDGKLRV